MLSKIVVSIRQVSQIKTTKRHFRNLVTDPGKSVFSMSRRMAEMWSVAEWLGLFWWQSKKMQSPLSFVTVSAKVVSTGELVDQSLQYRV